jgi:hypothetical protein
MERQSDCKTLASGLNNPRQATGGEREETSGKPGDTVLFVVRHEVALDERS